MFSSVWSSSSGITFVNETDDIIVAVRFKGLEPEKSGILLTREQYSVLLSNASMAEVDTEKPLGVFLGLFEMATGRVVLVRAFSKVGKSYPPKNATMIFGSLLRNESDTSLSMLLATPTRHEILDFLWPLGYIQGEFVFKRRAASSASDVFASRPLSAILVIGIAGLIGLSVGCLKTTNGGRSVKEFWFWAVSVASQQGLSEVKPRYRSGKLLMVYSASIGMICFNIYTAMLASEIATTRLTIGNSEDLYHQGFALMWNVKNNWLIRELKSRDKFFKRISDNRAMVSKERFGLSSLLYQDKRLFTVITNSKLQRLLSSDSVSLYQAGQIESVRVLNGRPEGKRLISLPFSKDPIKRRVITRGLLKLMETGLLRKSLTGNWIPRKRTFPTESPVYTSASLLQVRSAFVVFIVGVGAALTIFAAEVVVGIAKEPRLKRTLRIQEREKLDSSSVVQLGTFSFRHCQTCRCH